MLLYSEKLLSFSNSWTKYLLRVFMTRLSKLRLAVKGRKTILIMVAESEGIRSDPDSGS